MPPLAATRRPPQDIESASQLRLLQVQLPDADELRTQMADGLLASEASIAPKFFYDELGSHLFCAITALAEYTPTRSEAEILARHRPEIARAIGAASTLIDLGAGNCSKAARLFDVLRPRQYVAVDISVDFLRGSLRSLQSEHPAIEILGLGMDFARGLTLPSEVRRERCVFFYPGSSIGNFAPDEAAAFLRTLRAAGGGDAQLLIGVDLVKDAAVLNAAYDDPLGVTAAFNRNVLRHANRLLGADFDVARWRHIAFYAPADARIEMHLEALEGTIVRWPGAERRFARGERIHTENSYKYRPDAFRALLQASGWDPQHVWLDDRAWFAVFHCRA
jgi:dimethylhistidine N-methyltransferase